MIPAPITIDGRTGTVVYLDAKWHPVPPEQATMARVLFDDGGTAFYTTNEETVQSIAGLGGITRKFDEAKHPRDKEGKFIEATHPRIFNRPSDVGSYESWGGGTKWGWKDPKTGEQTGMLLTGVPIPREQLPPVLYHVTTNAPAVESSGVLLGLREDGGMGGGQAEGVSFTSSKEDALVIQRELRRAVRVARGEDRIEDLDRYAREDEQMAGLPPHTLDDAVQFAKDQWVANQQGIEHTFVWDKDLPEDKRGYVGPPPPPEEQERLRRSSMNDALKAYLQIRGKHDVQYPLLKNPILFGRQEHLAKLNPEHVQILETAAEDIPAEALVSTGSDKFLHEVRVYADVPRRRKKAAREYVREPAGTAEGGQFADAAMSAPILQGVNSKANAQREIDRHLDAWLKLTEKEPTPEALKATEAELRALPMVHGTTVAGALGAVDQGLLSHADMEAQRVQLLDEIGDLEDHIVNIAGEVDWEEVSQWTEEQVHDLGLDRQDAQALLEYVKELQDIKRVMAGSTNTADEALGLDQFVFMTHGEKHQDYGNVAVIIDNDVMQKGFATERDIITTPGITDPDNEEHYAASGVESYQRTILKGDDYYAVAAAKAGSPDALLHRSREQLFEIKVPRVPKDEVLGFVVDDFETAQRLSDKLARRGKKEKVLYVEDQSYSGETKRFVQNQLKALQATGMWDDGLLERFREQHEGAHIL